MVLCDVHAELSRNKKRIPTFKILLVKRNVHGTNGKSTIDNNNNKNSTIVDMTIVGKYQK